MQNGSAGAFIQLSKGGACQAGELRQTPHLVNGLLSLLQVSENLLGNFVSLAILEEMSRVKDVR